ncbi:hypothetical protein [Pseudomonas sp. GXZC]|uniref:hypothetical protein n=1 Tax=Pseudomonas sp. GXZC TaxID=3003351 RepID=UPI0022AA2CC2|nr:hypothetical protein [Pseudomonas sp. GXZC]WAT28559.1 hypothetical protein OZ428_32245 [Pseudomonas sp. GXZC]
MSGTGGPQGPTIETSEVCDQLSFRAQLASTKEEIVDHLHVSNRPRNTPSVIIMAVDNEIFFGDQDANRCAFFVGVSRAKRRLVLTHAAARERPEGYTEKWKVHRTEQGKFFIQHTFRGHHSNELIDYFFDRNWRMSTVHGMWTSANLHDRVCQRFDSKISQQWIVVIAVKQRIFCLTGGNRH